MAVKFWFVFFCLFCFAFAFSNSFFKELVSIFSFSFCASILGFDFNFFSISIIFLCATGNFETFSKIFEVFIESLIEVFSAFISFSTFIVLLCFSSKFLEADKAAFPTFSNVPFIVLLAVFFSPFTE